MPGPSRVRNHHNEEISSPDSVFFTPGEYLEAWQHVKDIFSVSKCSLRFLKFFSNI